MFGGGFDPKKMQGLMKQMGMSQEEISASKVIIEKTEGNKIVINNPSIIKIKVQGQESFQVSGDIREERGVSEEDIKTVMEKTGADQDQAKKALEDTEDLADAILKFGE